VTASFKIGLLLTATDQASKVIQGMTSRATRSVTALQSRLQGVASATAKLGAVSGALGAATLAGVRPAVGAFASLEAAAAQLQNTLMTKDGNIPAVFAAIDATAQALGNRLPAATEDFYAMAASLKALGLSAETIAGGALEATAYLGVVSEPLGASLQEATEAMAKFGQTLGIAEKDMVAFADTVQRVEHLGARLSEFQYAVSRIGPPLKTVGYTGIEAANAIAPLIGLLLRAGKTGEEAGTGLRKIFEVAIMKGKFTDIATLVRDLEKLQKLDPAKRLAKLKKLFGADAMGIADLIASGGYDAIRREMENQASLNQKVANSLGTLQNLYKALTGTLQNLSALVGGALAPELKALAAWLNTLTSRTIDWAKAHPRLARALSLAAVAFGTVALGIAPVLIGLSLLARLLGVVIARSVLSKVAILALRAPLVALGLGAVAAAALLIGAFNPIEELWPEQWRRISDRIGRIVDDLIESLLRKLRWFAPLLPQSLLESTARMLEEIDRRKRIVAEVERHQPTRAPAVPLPSQLDSLLESTTRALDEIDRQIPQLAVPVPAVPMPPALRAPPVPALPPGGQKAPPVPAVPVPAVPAPPALRAPTVPTVPLPVVPLLKTPAAGREPQTRAPQALGSPALGAQAAGPLALGAPVPALRTPPAETRKTEVGGLVKIRIDQDGRARVKSLETRNPRVPLEVEAGLLGLGA
jgi:hypothetical protein